MKFITLVMVFLSFLSCGTGQLIHSSIPGNELYKVAILYPSGDGKTFNIDYYENKHMPMVAKFIGDNLKFYEIDKGIAGRTPDDAVPYVAVGYFYVLDVDDYNTAIGKNIETIIDDIKNYTNIQPIIQISEVKKVVSVNN